MKTIKVMSIIGIVLFSLMLIICFLSNYQDGAVAGFLGLLYAVAYSVVCLIQVNKNHVNISDTPAKSITQQLMELSELRKNGILSEEEFDAKKQQILG